MIEILNVTSVCFVILSNTHIPYVRVTDGSVSSSCCCCGFCFRSFWFEISNELVKTKRTINAGRACRTEISYVCYAYDVHMCESVVYHNN